MVKTKKLLILIFLLFLAISFGSCGGGGQQKDGYSKDSENNKPSEKGVTETKEVPFSKETIEEIKKRESLEPEIIPEPRVIPFQEQPPPKELKEPSPESQDKTLYEYSQTPVSDGIVSAQAPALSNNFTGLDDNNTTIPPDTMGAVGPSHLMETLNRGVGFFNKSTGELLSSVTLQSFWSSLGTGTGQPANYPFDPKVIYDQHSGSFIAVTLGGTSSQNSWLMIGVSANSDPTGTWYKWAIDADLDGSTQTDNWADYPNLGVDANYVYVAANMYDNFSSYKYSKLWVIPKAQLLSGQSTITWTEFSNPTGSGSTLQPVLTFGSPASEYIIHQGYSISGTTTPRRFFKIAKITFSGSTPSWTDMGYIEVASYPTSGFPDAPQLGSSNLIETNDSRLLNAVYRNGYIWTTHTVANDANTKTEVAWYQIDPSLASSSTSSAGTPVQQGRINDTNRWYYFPSIAVNSNGDAGIGFSGSSSTEYPSAYYTGRAFADTSGTMQAVAVLKTGLASYYKTFSGTRNRWGDYSATSIDPNDDLTFWTLQEYASTASGGYDRWGTWWGSFSISTSSDTTAPTNTTGSNFINSGASSMSSTTVTLSISATDNVGVTGYYASEGSSTPSASDTGWRVVASTTSYSASVSFTLSSGDGTKTVYVWFKDAAGNVSTAVSDTITLATDATAPTNTTSSNFINSGAASTNSTAVTLSISATDNVGVTGYYASEGSTTPSAGAAGWTLVTSTTSYSASVSFTLSSGDGTKTVYVWFKDAAGNVSTSVSDAITLSTTTSGGGSSDGSSGGSDGCGFVINDSRNNRPPFLSGMLLLLPVVWLMLRRMIMSAT